MPSATVRGGAGLCFIATAMHEDADVGSPGSNVAQEESRPATRS